jgi:hypothetical protein
MGLTPARAPRKGRIAQREPSRRHAAQCTDDFTRYRLKLSRFIGMWAEAWVQGFESTSPSAGSRVFGFLVKAEVTMIPRLAFLLAALVLGSCSSMQRELSDD